MDRRFMPLQSSMLHRPVSRRSVLGVGAAGIAALSAGRLIMPQQAGQQFVEGQPLTEPEVRRSRDGVLETTLLAKLSEVQVGGRTVTSMVYERSFPGPTLRVSQGDTLRIKLVNQLDQDTNLHTHGLHVSPSANSDNVLLHIDAGETVDFEFKIPKDHNAGMNWYHPHFHGLTTEQLFGGMAGALIIEGDVDRLPGIAGLRDRVMVIQATQHDRGGQAIQPSASRFQNRFSRPINGQINPTVDIRPGETQRWRLLNASPNVFFRLSLQGHMLNQIGSDGNCLDQMQPQEEILISPGERTEVLVQAGAPGRYELHSLEFDGGFSMQPDTVLATMVVSGEAQSPQPLPDKLLPFVDMRVLPPDTKRLITFQVLPLDRVAPVVPMATFTVNNKLFDMDRVDQVMDLGTTEEWTVRNGSNVWHPFHIHVNDFQITQINGKPYTAHGYKDTFPVPPFAEFTMRTRFLDYTGKYVFHCHILQHEDGGMMQVVEVK